MSQQERATLTDRLALAFLSAVTALLVGGLLWLCIAVLAAQLLFDEVPSFAWVLGFAGVMAALGFLLMENHVLRCVTAVGRWFARLARWV